MKDINYTWGSWKATITKHHRRDEFSWSVFDKHGNNTYDFNSHIDTILDTQKEAEDDMLQSINDRIGHAPKSKLS